MVGFEPLSFEKGLDSTSNRICHNIFKTHRSYRTLLHHPLIIASLQFDRGRCNLYSIILTIRHVLSLSICFALFFVWRAVWLGYVQTQDMCMCMRLNGNVTFIAQTIATTLYYPHRIDSSQNNKKSLWNKKPVLNVSKHRAGREKKICSLLNGTCGGSSFIFRLENMPTRKICHGRKKIIMVLRLLLLFYGMHSKNIVNLMNRFAYMQKLYIVRYMSALSSIKHIVQNKNETGMLTWTAKFVRVDIQHAFEFLNPFVSFSLK